MTGADRDRVACRAGRGGRWSWHALALAGFGRGGRWKGVELLRDHFAAAARLCALDVLAGEEVEGRQQEVLGPRRRGQKEEEEEAS